MELRTIGFVAWMMMFLSQLTVFFVLDMSGTTEVLNHLLHTWTLVCVVAYHVIQCQTLHSNLRVLTTQRSSDQVVEGYHQVQL